MKITILGAGIAGLTTAIVLKKIGIETEIFEASSQIKPVGAGLALAPNAMKALREMDLAKEVYSQGRELGYFNIIDKKGKTIISTDNTIIKAKFGEPSIAIHRSKLHQLLLEKLNNPHLYCGKRAESFQKDGSLIRLQFNDGLWHETEHLIVADGIHSPIRKQLLPQSELRYAGYTCWRGILSDSSITQNGATETWDTKGRFGIVPLTNDQIYWYACINADANSKTIKNFSQEQLIKHFEGFHHPVSQIIEKTELQNLILNDIYDLVPIDKYAYDNILLIGDAGHATTPNMGQGACQAIEDAVVLGKELSRHPNPKNAFMSFEEKRLLRTHYVTNQSRLIGTMAHTESAILAGLRNMALRLTPDKIRQKQFAELYNIEF